MNFPLFGHSPAPAWDLPGAAGEPLLCGPLWAVGAHVSSWSSPEAAEGSLLQCLEYMLPLLSTALGICRAHSLTYSHSLLWLQSLQCSNSPPLLKSVFLAALLLSPMGLALTSCRSILELGGIGSIRHWRSFLQLLRETTSVAPCFQNLVMQTQR